MANQSHDDDHSHGSTALYLSVFGALCLLTMASFLTYYEFWDSKVPTNISRAFMMAVSCAKATLVIMFFMHLKWEANWKYVLTIPAALMSVFLVLMLVPDIGCRYSHYSEERLLHAAEEIQEGDEHGEHVGNAEPHMHETHGHETHGHGSNQTGHDEH